MPINFQEIRNQVKIMGAAAPQYYLGLRNQREAADKILNEKSDNIDWLQKRVEAASVLNNKLRTAVPVAESLLARIPNPQSNLPSAILAADGSQIYPSRHDRVKFGLINVGAIRMQPGSGVPPRETIRSELLTFDKLHPGEADLTEGSISLMRDIEERTILAELARQEDPPVVALTDGQLEPFPTGTETAQFEDLFKKYIKSLKELCQLNVCTAGYVDKSGSNLVVRLLEIALLSEENLINAGRPEGRRFQSLTDIDLYAHVLQHGERSAVFAIRSEMARRFTDSLALHFFYLNVGTESHPYLARVEIPAWVAEDQELLNMLHTTLVEQCRYLGSKPYPYLLHRSHEVAVVTFAEKDQLENMIQVELLRNGIVLGDQSGKQNKKDASREK